MADRGGPDALKTVPEAGTRGSCFPSAKGFPSPKMILDLLPPETPAGDRETLFPHPKGMVLGRSPLFMPVLLRVRALMEANFQDFAPVRSFR